jgi:hypothetical protein
MKGQIAALVEEETPLPSSDRVETRAQEHTDRKEIV